MSNDTMLTISEDQLRTHLRRALDPFTFLTESIEFGQEYSPIASMLSYLIEQQERSNIAFIKQLEENSHA